MYISVSVSVPVILLCVSGLVRSVDAAYPSSVAATDCTYDICAKHQRSDGGFQSIECRNLGIGKSYHDDSRWLYCPNPTTCAAANFVRMCGSAQNKVCPARMSTVGYVGTPASHGNDGITTIDSLVHSEETSASAHVFQVGFEKTRIMEYVTFYNRVNFVVSGLLRLKSELEPVHDKRITKYVPISISMQFKHMVATWWAGIFP